MNGRHFGARLHDYTLQGYRTIALENEVLRVEVLADKGSDIVALPAQALRHGLHVAPRGRPPGGGPGR